MLLNPSADHVMSDSSTVRPAQSDQPLSQGSWSFTPDGRFRQVKWLFRKSFIIKIVKIRQIMELLSIVYFQKGFVFKNIVLIFLLP